MNCAQGTSLFHDNQMVILQARERRVNLGWRTFGQLCEISNRAPPIDE